MQGGKVRGWPWQANGIDWVGESSTYGVPAVWPSASHLHSLSQTFFICEMRVVKLLSSVIRMKYANIWEILCELRVEKYMLLVSLSCSFNSGHIWWCRQWGSFCCSQSASVSQSIKTRGPFEFYCVTHLHVVHFLAKGKMLTPHPLHPEFLSLRQIFSP